MRDPEKVRAAVRRHYAKNKDYYLERNRRKRNELDNYVRKLKESSLCTDCSRKFPHYVLEFDHARGTKSINIGKATSWKSLLAEIEKCDIVCANCHAARTWFRRQEASSCGEKVDTPD